MEENPCEAAFIAAVLGRNLYSYVATDSSDKDTVVENIIIVGNNVKLTLQTMLAVYSRWKSRCVLIGDTTCKASARSRLCRRHIEVRLDGTEDGRFISEVNELALRLDGPVLVPADCEGVRILSRLNDRILARVVPVMNDRQMDTLEDKWNFYRFCRDHGIRTPETLYFDKKRDIDFETVVAKFGLPFVVKPTNEAGSSGVHFVYSKAYFEDEILNNASYTFEPLLAQRFIKGRDGALGVFALDGQLQAYGIQRYRRSATEFIGNDYIEREIRRLCTIIDFHGVGEFDLMFEDSTEDVYITEANPRVWGSNYASVWCGLNFVAECVENPLGLPATKALTHGYFHPGRHPLLWPRSWWYLLTGAGERGRMARAMTFDGVILPEFLQSLPWRARKYLRSRVFRRGSVATRPYA